MEKKYKIVRMFLRNDLKITPNKASYSVLSKALEAVLEDVNNFTGITGIDGDAKKADRNVRYLIETIYRTESYKKIVGENKIITPKDFIVKCYDFVVDNYL